MLKKEFEFILQDTLIYSHEGKAGITAKRLLLRAPTTKLLSLASKLSSTVMSALIKAREMYKDKEGDGKGSAQGGDVDGDTIYMLISGSIDTKQMSDFIETFQELILSTNICLVDGKEPLTLDLFNSLDSRETLRLVGDYIANFLLPSIMGNSKKRT
jgi:hypothetical protein